MPKLKIKTRICRVCRKVEKGKSRDLVSEYCSRKCWIQTCGKHLRTGRVIRCKQCQKPRYVRGASVKRGAKFCSWKCVLKFRKATRRANRRCRFCRRSFYPDEESRKFCSYECSKSGKNNPNWAGGKCRRVYLAADRRLKTQVILQKKRTCENCGKRGGKLHIHHIKSIRNFPELRWERSNVLLLCFDCHTLTDNYGFKAIQSMNT